MMSPREVHVSFEGGDPFAHVTEQMPELEQGDILMFEVVDRAPMEDSALGITLRFVEVM